MFSITSQVRPPTPPKESIENTLRFLDTSVSVSPQISHTSKSSKPNSSELATPPLTSPLSSPSKPQTSPSKRSKQLRFLSQPSFIESNAEGEVFPRATKLKPITPSRHRQSTKSILKPFDPSTPSESSDEDPFSLALSSRTFFTLAAMLESVVQQLAGGERSAKVDAYLVICNGLKTSDPALDVGALGSKLPLLEDFIRRDMVIVNPGTGSVDVKLAVQALKLTSILLFMLPQPTYRFTSDFMGYMVDHSLHVISTIGLPKELVMNHLQLLTQERMHTKIMTTERASKLLAALGTIQSRVSGNGVVGIRFVLFNILLARSPAIMTSGVQHWIPHIFHGMLSSIKDVRQRAIETGLAAGNAVGDSKQVSSFVHVMFAGKSTEQDTYFDHLEQGLQTLLVSKDKEDCYVAPQIWSVVVGLLRNKQCGIERWSRLVQWFRVIQHCFNSSDLHLNSQAWVAWSRLTYAIDLSKSTRPALIQALRKPVISQLQRRSGKGAIDRHKREALSTYYLLLYQAFRPEAPWEQLDLYFKELVAPVVQEVTKRNVASAEVLCQVVSTLFEKTGSNLWNRDRAVSASTKPLEMEELPLLDPRWTRKNIRLILSVFEMFLDSTSELTAAQLNFWESAMMSVSAAGSKEITASTELRQAVAEVTNTLQRLCRMPPRALRKATSTKPFHTSYWSLVQAAITSLGPIHFVERNLLRVSSGLFEVAPTPSRAAATHKSTLTSAFLSIFEALHDCLPSVQGADSLHSETLLILDHCVKVKTAFRSKLALLQDCAHVLTKSPLSKSPNGLWTALVEMTSKIIDDRSVVEPGIDSASRLQHDYSAASTILFAGLHFADAESLSFGKRLLQNIIRRYTRETREVFVILSIIQALSKSQLDSPTLFSNAISAYIATVLNEIPSITTRTRREANLRVKEEHDRSTEKNFLHLYTECGSVLAQTLLKSYGVEDTSVVVLVDVVETLASHFKRADIYSRNLLQSIALGLVMWIVDVKGVLFTSNGEVSQLAVPMLELWETSLQLLYSMHKRGQEDLEASESFWLAGFRSHSKRVANTTIEIWNLMAEDLEVVAYPSKLQSTLAQLRLVAEVQAPFLSAREESNTSLPESQQQQIDDELKTFFPWMMSTDSQVSTDFEGPQSSMPYKTSKEAPTVSTAASAKVSLPTTPRKSLPKHIAHKTPPTRLRHNDSQVQFVAVESSPVNPSEMESQMLTERQKEVMRRHNDDAVLFSDIRSSPIVKKQSRSARSTPRRAASISHEKVDAEMDLPLVIDVVEKTFVDTGLDTSSGNQGRVAETQFATETSASELAPADTDVEQAQLNDPPQIVEDVSNTNTVRLTVFGETVEDIANIETPTNMDKPENLVNVETREKISGLSATAHEELSQTLVEDLNTDNKQGSAVDDDKVSLRSSSPISFVSSEPQTSPSNPLAATVASISLETSQTLVASQVPPAKTQSIPETQIGKRQSFRAVVVELRPSPKKITSSFTTNPFETTSSETTITTPLNFSAKGAKPSRRMPSFTGTLNVSTRSATASFSQESPLENDNGRVTRSSKRKLPADFSPSETKMSSRDRSRGGRTSSAAQKTSVGEASSSRDIEEVDGAIIVEAPRRTLRSGAASSPATPSGAETEHNASLDATEPNATEEDQARQGTPERRHIPTIRGSQGARAQRFQSGGVTSTPRRTNRSSMMPPPAQPVTTPTRSSRSRPAEDLPASTPNTRGKRKLAEIRVSADDEEGDAAEKEKRPKKKRISDEVPAMSTRSKKALRKTPEEENDDEEIELDGDSSDGAEMQEVQAADDAANNTAKAIFDRKDEPEDVEMDEAGMPKQKQKQKQKQKRTGDSDMEEPPARSTAKAMPNEDVEMDLSLVEKTSSDTASNTDGDGGASDSHEGEISGAGEDEDENEDNAAAPAVPPRAFAPITYDMVGHLSGETSGTDSVVKLSREASHAVSQSSEAAFPPSRPSSHLIDARESGTTSVAEGALEETTLELDERAVAAAHEHDVDVQLRTENAGVDMAEHCALPLTTTIPASPTRKERALGLIATFKGLLMDCRNLILGSQEEDERRELQDLTLEWQTALVQAERKGREEERAARGL